MESSSLFSEVMFRTSKQGNWEYHKTPNKFSYALSKLRYPYISLYLRFSSSILCLRRSSFVGSRANSSFWILDEFDIDDWDEAEVEEESMVLKDWSFEVVLPKEGAVVEFVVSIVVIFVVAVILFAPCEALLVVEIASVDLKGPEELLMVCISDTVAVYTIH